MRSFAKSYNQYLKELSPQQSVIISKLADMIMSYAPKSRIVMKWGMPVFTQNNESFLGIAAHSLYYSIYIWNFNWKKEFSKKIKKFNTGKDCLRFKKLDQLSEEFLELIVERSIQENHY